MEQLFKILILIILLSILASSVWNIILFRRIRKEIKTHNGISDIENYLEIKYRIQFLTTIFAIIIFVAGFFGFNSIKGFEDKIQKEIDAKFSKFTTSFDSLTIKKDSLSYDYSAISTTVKGIKDKIIWIYSKNILKPEIFIVKNIPVKPKFESQKVYYRNMLTITNEKLPKFINRPVVSISSPSGTIPIINKLTNEYIEFYGTAMTTGEAVELYYVDLWIVTYDKL